MLSCIYQSISHYFKCSVATLILFVVGTQVATSQPTKTRDQLELERATFLIRQAFEEDEAGDREEAVQLYTQAVELCLNIVSGVT